MTHRFLGAKSRKVDTHACSGLHSHRGCWPLRTKSRVSAQELVREFLVPFAHSGGLVGGGASCRLVFPTLLYGAFATVVM